MEDGESEIIIKVDVVIVFLRYTGKQLNRKFAVQFWASNLKIFFKQDKFSIPCEYRVNNLTSLVTNLVNRMTLNNILPAVDTCLSGNQRGFTPRKATNTQILALSHILEGVKGKNIQIYLLRCSSSISESFDCVNHTTMFNILEIYAISKVKRSVIQNTYRNQKARLQMLTQNTLRYIFENCRLVHLPFNH